MMRLSYDISAHSPVYPSDAPVKITEKTSIKKGDAYYTYSLAFSNHVGTHVDCPKHFFERGRNVSSYAPDELIFKKPCILSLNKGPSEIIDIKDLGPLKRAKRPDIVLIRTGFWKYRAKDPGRYSRSNPCILPEAALWLRENLPSVKAIGIDCISIGSYANRQYGRKTHKILLREKGGQAVLIVEDMYLPDKIRKLKQVMLVPLFIEGIDSAPCTVIGILN